MNPAPNVSRASGLDVLLGRLQGVQADGDGRWMAHCPACGNFSCVAIDEGDEETGPLVWCAGCEDRDAVLAALDLKFDDMVAGSSDLQARARRRKVSEAVVSMDAFLRSAAINRAGLTEEYEAAESAGDLDTCARLAEQVGRPFEELEAGTSSQAPGFVFTRVGDRLVGGLKPIQWLVRDYVEADSLALLFGDPAAGKSFLAIDLACCIATGTPWHGNRTTPGAVFYIAGEGQNGLDRRFAAWSQGNGITLRGMPLFSSSRPAMLCTAGGAAEVANAVEATIEQEGRTPALIVVDTLARNFGGDENSQEDMGAFIANLDMFLRKSGEWSATVLIVHHSGHADKTRGRGSSALKGAVDAEYSATKGEDGIVRVDATKMKDAKHPEPVALKMDVVELDGECDEDGEPITSVALRCVAHVPPAKAGKAARGKNQTIALSVLAQMIAEQRARLEASGHNPDGARVVVDAWRDRLAAKGLNKQRFYDVRSTLKDAGLIAIEFGGYVRLIKDRPL